MNKSLSKLALVSTVALAPLYAAELSFSGLIDADVAALTTTEFNQVDFYNNHEIDLTASLKFSEKVSVDLFLTSVTGTIPAHGGSTADRWSTVDFDGVTLNLETDNGATINVGDLVFTEGAMGYYFYRRTIAYAAIMKETYVRGAGFGMSGAYVGFGALDGVATDSLGNTTSPIAAYLSYEYGSDAFTVKPFALFHTSQQEDMGIKAGVTSKVTAGDHSVSVAAGYLKDQDMEPTFTLLFEPSLSFGAFSVAATAFYAITDDAEPSVYDVPEEAFYYVEPGYKLSDEFAVGLPIEFHTYEKDVDDNVLALVPTFYIYPAEGVQWWVWGGVALALDDDDAKPGLSLGSEMIVNF